LKKVVAVGTGRKSGDELKGPDYEKGVGGEVVLTRKVTSSRERGKKVM